jgi:hypothetical protein
MAVKALTNQPSSDPDATVIMIGERKRLYLEATSRYLSLLSSVDVRLRRQIYALEEANIISAEIAPKETQAGFSKPGGPTTVGGSTFPTVKEKVPVSGNGLGDLDVGWLNSRNDKVGKQMESELWATARNLVRDLGLHGVKIERKSSKSVEMDEGGDEDDFVPVPSG